ncbi:AAA family ATPase [Candidatus Acetothermia bacterium]|nr:AAA family ATPase [Candidatus Acetothermia bacterium]
MSLQVYTLGTFSIRRGETPITDLDWKTQKNKTLLKILITHRGHPLSKDQLIEWIWPELDVAAAGRDLRVAVSRSRQVLEPDLSRSSQSSFILTTPAGYAWNTKAVCWLDAAEFEALCSELDRDLQPENLEHQLAIAERAKALYRGDYLEEDRYADWATAKREELSEIYFALLTRMAEIHARQGRYRRSIALCREVLAASACRESVYRQLMLYYYLSGNPSETVRAYEQCVQALKDELDVEPVSQTRQLYEQIRAQQVPEIDKFYPLVQELVSTAQRQFNARIFQGRAQELGFQRSYQPWVEIVHEALEQLKHADLIAIPALWLIEVAKLAPELRTRMPSLPENPSLSPKQEQLRFFEGLIQFFQSLVESKHAPKPLVLLLDDLHWVDSSSLDFLNYFNSHIEDKPILILGIYRSEELNEEHPLSRLIQAWKPKTLLQNVSLSRLAAQEISELLKKLPLTIEQPHLFSGWLYKETAGNPLFLVSTLQHFFEEGILRVEGSSWIADLEDLSVGNKKLMIPPTIRELITQRVARLGELDEKFLRLASVAGREVELPLLEKAWE